MLQNETALITGASRGIGRCMAESFAARGIHLALVGHTPGSLDASLAACRAHGVQAHPFYQDLADTAALAELVRAAAEKLGGSISFLINNAGVWAGGDFSQLDLAEADRAIALNTRSVLLLTQHALPFILKAKQRGVINIASLSGQASHGNGSVYCATKHAVVAFSRALFEDVHLQGVKVCAICPGFVETDMTEHLGIAPEKIIAPQDVVNAALYVLTQSARVCPVEIILRSQQLKGVRA